MGLPANFGRFCGLNGPAGGAFAPVEGREIAGDVAGGVAAADWRLWCWPHWRQPAVSPTRKGGESAIFGAGGDQPPLATSRRCCLAAARLCVPPTDPTPDAGDDREVPGAREAVVMLVTPAGRRESRCALARDF